MKSSLRKTKDLGMRRHFNINISARVASISALMVTLAFFLVVTPSVEARRNGGAGVTTGNNHARAPWKYRYHSRVSAQEQERRRTKTIERQRIKAKSQRGNTRHEDQGVVPEPEQP